MATTSAQVQQLYVAYLGRAADKAGLDYWMAELNATPAVLTLENLRANFVNEQPEYSDAYAGLSRQDTVIKIYNNLFGRTPDAAGLTYWTTGAGASVNADQLLTAFVNGAATADAAVLSNKVLVSEVYTSAAGANYAKADATSILVGVNGTSTSVAAAIAKLEDGSLSGVAIPAGVAALKAEALADKAVIDYDASKVEALKALNDKVVALNATKAIPLTTLTAIADGDDTDSIVGNSYNEVVVAIANATALRTSFGEATPVLQSKADQAVKDLAATRDTYTKATTGNVDKAVAYEKALTAAAGLKNSDNAVVLNTTSKTQIDFATATTGAPGLAALAKANADAGLAAGTVTDAATLFTALTSDTATAAQVKTITDAFDVLLKGSADYATLKTLAVTNHTKAVADKAVTDTAAAITGTGAAAYKQDVTDKIVADKTLADAKAADALVEATKAIADGHKALQDAADAIVLPTNLKALGVDGTDKADLFYFAAKVTSDDFTIGTATTSTQFNKGDALYIGEGYSLNTTAKYDAATGLTGGKNGALEVFFIKDSGVVKAVVEVSDLGSSTVVGGTLGSTADQVSVITLTGVTDIAQVSFANGVISHVA